MTLYGKSTTGHDLLRNFDLVAANSGGSLVLAGLVENLTLGEIFQYFMEEDNRRSIFSPTTMVGDDLLRLILGVGPKYNAAAKLPAIERLLPKTGDAPLAGCTDKVIGPNGSPVHLLIVGFDYDRNRATFFRSAAAGGPDWGEGQPAKVSLAGAVHASTNAPVNYFDAPAELPGAEDRYWDGGVTGCNNPAVAAVVESIVLGNSPQDINVLTLGTGTVSLPLAKIGAPASPLEAPRSNWTFPNDLKKLAGAILDDPPDAASFIAYAITGGNVGLQPPVISRIIRMSPLISPLPTAGGGWMPPKGWSVAQFQYLSQIDMDALTPMEIRFINDYCTFWLEDRAPNQPIRSNGQTFDPQKPEIGYAKFSEARAAWRVLLPPVSAPPVARRPKKVAERSSRRRGRSRS
jgi:hypothetical protein